VVYAYAFNHQVPGPRIELTDGDRVRIVVTNHLPEPTTVHWHGLVVPNAMDGPAEITQAPIQPGDSYTYEFTVQQAGTFMYHPRPRRPPTGARPLRRPDRQAGEPRPRPASQLPARRRDRAEEWLVRDGLTYRPC